MPHAPALLAGLLSITSRDPPLQPCTTTPLLFPTCSYVQQGLLYAQQDAPALQAHVHCVEDTQALREQLPGLGLVAFVGDGSILPRHAAGCSCGYMYALWACSTAGMHARRDCRLPPACPPRSGCRVSGACDEPMPASQAVPFRAPDLLAVTVTLPNRGAVRGLGVRRGVTLIVGGGFHGKSTLLEAIEGGVYNKVGGHMAGGRWGGQAAAGWETRSGGVTPPPARPAHCQPVRPAARSRRSLGTGGS